MRKNQSVFLRISQGAAIGIFPNMVGAGARTVYQK
jgi:hypothetical protein